MAPDTPNARKRPGKAVALLGVALAALVGAATTEPSVPTYQGFGAATPGGAGQAVARVTTLDDSGPGSLREALADGHRTVAFDVAGDIVLRRHVVVRGAFVTIDGASAPSPGITLRDRGLRISGRRGAHDVIVRGLRVRGSSEDGITVNERAHNVVIDHVSIQGSRDGNLDITDSRDVTVSWSILAEPALDQKNMLIKYNPARVTLHHNLFVGAKQRNPMVRIDDAGTPATETTLDMRNNVVWDWGPGYGTIVSHGARGNVVGNFYSARASARRDQEQALTVCDGRRPLARCAGGPAARALVFVAGNVSGDPVTVDLDAESTASAPLAAPEVETTDACTAARAVLAGAGVRPLDAIDRSYLDRVTLTASRAGAACARGEPLVGAGGRRR